MSETWLPNVISVFGQREATRQLTVTDVTQIGGGVLISAGCPAGAAAPAYQAIVSMPTSRSSGPQALPR